MGATAACCVATGVALRVGTFACRGSSGHGSQDHGLVLLDRLLQKLLAVLQSCLECALGAAQLGGLCALRVCLYRPVAVAQLVHFDGDVSVRLLNVRNRMRQHTVIMRRQGALAASVSQSALNWCLACCLPTTSARKHILTSPSSTTCFASGTAGPTRLSTHRGQRSHMPADTHAT